MIERPLATIVTVGALVSSGAAMAATVENHNDLVAADTAANIYHDQLKTTLEADARTVADEARDARDDSALLTVGLFAGALLVGPGKLRLRLPPAFTRDRADKSSGS